MFDWLKLIVDGLLLVGEFVLWALMSAVNLIIAAVGLLLEALLLLLPLMPATPTAPVTEWVGWLNWLFPVGELLAGLAVCVGLWLVFIVVRIPLKWVKAL